MYARGLGVPQDYAEAVRWYRLAADQGHASAQNNLGVMYATGEGVLQDYVQAHMWYNLAASRPTHVLRDLAVEGRDRVAGELTPAALNEAQRLAREWDEAHPREP
jgi:TPR repeat protein